MGRKITKISMYVNVSWCIIEGITTLKNFNKIYFYFIHKPFSKYGSLQKLNYHIKKKQKTNKKNREGRGTVVWVLIHKYRMTFIYKMSFSNQQTF